MTGSFRVHGDAAGRRTPTPRQRRVYAVQTTKVDPLLWAWVRQQMEHHGYTDVEVISSTQVHLK